MTTVRQATRRQAAGRGEAGSRRDPTVVRDGATRPTAGTPTVTRATRRSLREEQRRLAREELAAVLFLVAALVVVLTMLGLQWLGTSSAPTSLAHLYVGGFTT